MKDLFKILVLLILLVIPFGLMLYKYNLYSMMALYLPKLDAPFLLSSMAFMWISIFCGYIIACCFNSLRNSNDKDLNSYKNQYEKISVSNEEQSDRVKILEEKIKSLEIALAKALEK